MFFKQLTTKESSLSYFFGCVGLGKAVAVDMVAGDEDWFIEATRGPKIEITHLIDTHVQADHYSGGHALAQRANAPNCSHEFNRDQVKFDFLPLEDGQVLGNVKIKVLHTPGHTPESLCLLVTDVRRGEAPSSCVYGIRAQQAGMQARETVAELAEVVRGHGYLMHPDAAQSAGKLALDVDELGVDFLALSSHKFDALKGTGPLCVLRGTPFAGILHDAEQEHALRPVTENVPYIVALCAAATLADSRFNEAVLHVTATCNALHARLADGVPSPVLNGHAEFRLPNTLHLSFPHVAGQALLADAAAVLAASVVSACHSEGDAVSGVLETMGIDAAQAKGAIRLSKRWATTLQDTERAADALIAAWPRLVHQ